MVVVVVDVVDVVSEVAAAAVVAVVVTVEVLIADIVVQGSAKILFLGCVTCAQKRVTQPTQQNVIP